MFEYLSIIVSVVSVLVSVLNLIIINLKKEYEIKNSIEEILHSLSIQKNKNLTNYSEVQSYLSYLSDTLEKMYPSAKTEISIHILEKNNKNLEDSTVEDWIPLPSGKKRKYTVKNNTDFKSLLLENNKYFFVTDLNKFETLSDYINENPEYTNWQTTISFPIRDNKSGSSDIIGFLCAVSPEKFNNVKNNKKIISFFSKASKLLSEAITNNSSDSENPIEIMTSSDF